ncbi:hypothetical protein V4B17_00185 [Bartonella sp. B23]
MTHVADGKVAEDLKDAINGRQFWFINDKVSNIENKAGTTNQHVKDIEISVANGAVSHDKDDDGKKT